MKTNIIAGQQVLSPCDLMLYPICSKSEQKDLEKSLGSEMRNACLRYDFQAEAGKRFTFSSQNKHVRLSALSSEPAFEEWRKLGGDAVQEARRLKAGSLAVSLQKVPEKQISQTLQAVLEGALLADYTYTKFKNSKESKSSSVKTLTILLDRKASKETSRAQKTAKAAVEAACFARDLVNCPPSDLPPKGLVQAARKITGGSKGRVTTRVMGRGALKKLGAEGILGVSRGSTEEPFLIHLQYKPQKITKKTKTVVIVGKGVTFDSGGLSIKLGSGMEDMKCDMAGAAAVLGIMKALASPPVSSQIAHQVHALVPTTENMINGESLKPGDVIKHLNGKTVEVLNTDAEGRLILADALSYSKRLKPDVIVDLATLTGASVVALGTDYSALFSNDEKLQNLLHKLGEETGEHFWPMPLAKEYRELLESNVADIKNIGSRYGGAITAALFLKEFIPEKASWAHLDIAGPAFLTKGNEYLPTGGTGVGVRTLLRLLQEL